MLIFLIFLIIRFIFILLGIAFFTLLERKILSLRQIRVGPNKLSFFGILQPVFDGLKLMIKELMIPQKTTKKIILFFPIIIFCFIFQLWLIIPQFFSSFNLKWNILGLLIILGIRIYSVLITGNISSSKFGLIGGIRAAAQNVRYEIMLIIILFSPILLLFSFNIYSTLFFNILNISILIFPIWWISCIAETNRAPFDLAEGERELIRGFNVEYGRTRFIFIFLREYGIILVFSIISRIVFFQKSFLLFIILFCLIIILRRSFPRIRYDILIKICWILFLPYSIFFLLLILLIK